MLRLLLITNFRRGLSIMEPGATLQGEGNQKPSLATPKQKRVSQLNSGLQCGGSASWPVPLLCLPFFSFCSVAMQNRLLSLELSASCLRVSASFHLAAPNLSTNTIQMQLPARHPCGTSFSRPIQKGHKGAGLALPNAFSRCWVLLPHQDFQPGEAFV